MKDMLDVLSKGEEVNKTKIVYGANLNFERASRILNWLMEKGLVKSNSDTYKITERFNLYEWMCTPLNDTIITVCADYENSITECIEHNNCRTEIWSCTSSTQQVQSSSNGNIILDAFKAILSFFR